MGGGSSNDDVIHPFRDVSRVQQMIVFCLFCFFFLFHNHLLFRLTNTPRKTSGHGWTLVNVGLTMAIAILEEKWVRGEKSEKRVRVKKWLKKWFSRLNSTYYPYN